MSNEQSTNQPQDVDAHNFKCGGPAEEAQDVDAHAFGFRFDPAEGPQDVEAHAFKINRAEDAPPAKPGTDGRDDDVVAHNGRWG